MKLSEIKGEQALDVLAEIIEPIAEITADEEFIRLTKSNATKAKIVAYTIRNHKREVIQMLAALELKKPEEFEFTLLTLPQKLKELFDDEEVMSLFS
jgi:hypothetical protein